MRIRCWAFGCLLDKHDCHRCGAALYDYEFIQIGWIKDRFPRIYAIPFFLSEFIGIIGRRCDVCKKRMWLSGEVFCCSHECYDKWMPF